MPRPRLLIVDGEGGSRSPWGHTAPDLTVRLHQGFARHFSLTLALLGPVTGHERTLPRECQVVYLPAYSTKWGYLRVRRETRRTLDHAISEADLILVRIPSFHGVDALALAQRHLAPAICFVVGIWEEAFGRAPSLRSAVYGRLARFLTVSGARKGTLVLAQGTHLTHYLGGFGIRALTVTESPLEPDDFIPSNGHVNRGVMRIISVSRLVPTKNIEALVHAVRSLADEGRHSELTIVGEGGYRETLERLIARLDLDDRVRLLGQIEDRAEIRRLLSSSNVFVLPSVSEGMPLSVLEAMAAGIPVVAAPIGGMRDLLVDGLNAVLVDEPTPQRIHRAVAGLVDDPERARVIGARGRETARGFLHESWVERFSQIVTTELSGIGVG